MEETLATHQTSVLLVDDNELLLASMKRFFSKQFHHVAAVCTGEEALPLMHERLYGIIVLDIHLPGIDGWKVLDHARQHSPFSKVVITTSDAEAPARQIAFQKGAFEFLEKPFELDELKAVIMRCPSMPDNATL